MRLFFIAILVSLAVGDPLNVPTQKMLWKFADRAPKNRFIEALPIAVGADMTHAIFPLRGLKFPFDDKEGSFRNDGDECLMCFCYASKANIAAHSRCKESFKTHAFVCFSGVKVGIKDFEYRVYTSMVPDKPIVFATGPGHDYSFPVFYLTDEGGHGSGIYDHNHKAKSILAHPIQVNFTQSAKPKPFISAHFWTKGTICDTHVKNVHLLTKNILDGPVSDAEPSSYISTPSVEEAEGRLKAKKRCKSV
ncbi:hypothetical protein L596_016680 [Steinernema carpocapsae]|uniref:Fungal lipase-like domain-containing protein n=1 Tax=Steinernema carpocapsae TaxID=34508 RepID=A0A4V6A3G5_STECR|nr:hypothetical protein L596_016680 [Steinernema carpocapsae]